MLELLLEELRALIALVGGFVVAHIWAILGVIVAGAAVGLATAAILPAHFERFRKEQQPRLFVFGRLLALLLVASLGATLIGVERKVTDAYRATRGSSGFVSVAGGEGPPVEQYSPYAALIQPQQRKVGDLLPGIQLSDQALGILNNALQRTTKRGAETPVVERAADGLQLTAQKQFESEERISIDKADIRVKLGARTSSSKSNAYDLTYEGTFEFANKTDTEATARFSFPIPDNGGTYRNVKFAVDGQAVGSSDDNGNAVWTGTLRPGQKAKASLSYETAATGTFRLEISTGMRRVSDLTVRLDAPDSVKFAQQSLPFTKRDGGAYVWSLGNLVSSQSIAVAIPFERQSREIGAKAYDLAQIAFVVLALCLAWLGLDFKVTILPLAAFFAASVVPVMWVDRPEGSLLAWVVGLLGATVVSFALRGPKLGALVLLMGGIVLAAWFGPTTTIMACVFGIAAILVMNRRPAT